MSVGVTSVVKPASPASLFVALLCSLRRLFDARLPARRSSGEPSLYDVPTVTALALNDWWLNLETKRKSVEMELLVRRDTCAHWDPLLLTLLYPQGPARAIHAPVVHLNLSSSHR